jgi:peroxiredoxin/mono/diheme cytochrome c family protein
MPRLFALLVTLIAIAGINPLFAEPTPIDRGLGLPVQNFTLRDTAGKEVQLYSYAGKKAVVVVFIGTGCPVNDLYLPRLAEMAKEYSKKEVAFLAIASNHGEEPAAVAKHVKAHGVEFPVLMDRNNRLADILLAERTCETLIINGLNAKIMYRGAIDDQYTPTAKKGQPTQNYLKDALESIIAGKVIPTKATIVAGCPLERAPKREVQRVRPAPVSDALPEIDPKTIGKVTYSNHVADILQRKCQQCHRPGEVGPFSLLTFEDARKRGKAITEVVTERRMPPWHADPKHGKFSNDRSLSPKERATLLAWVDQGMPAGDAKDSPKPREFVEGWSIGKPDVVFSMPKSYVVAAQGTLPYQNFRVKTNFKEDVWIQAAEARPGDRSVVHHILVLVDEGKGKRNRAEADGYLAVYVPGDAPSVYAPGTAKRIPAGADLIFQMHYTPIGQAKSDLSSVGLIFAKEPPQFRAVTHGIAQTRLEIPAEAENHPVEAAITLPKPIRLLSFFPHMHLRGKSFQYTATYPDGKKEVLLSVPAYDFAWQSVYRLAEPKILPKGTRIDCLAHYDNSSKNPANPDPTITVRWGEQTYEEMLIGYLDYSEVVATNSDVKEPRTK